MRLSFYRPNSQVQKKKRFIKEAKAASSLNHPNICTIYDILEYEDSQTEKQLFLVMEFVEGQTLKNIVESHYNASLSIKNVINVAIQIADGLAAAHEKRIIHRDIKPDNIML